MRERWKPVEGYEGLYWVSTKGRVRSRFKYLKPVKLNCDRPNSYLIVGLSKNGKATNVGIHVLVARAFIPNPKNKPEVNHDDLDKQNNHDWNLEWVTRSENAIHALQNGIGQFGSRTWNSKLSERMVRIIRILLKRNVCPTKIARRFKVNKMTIYDIQNFVTWNHVK